MPAAGRSEYRLATRPVMGFIHPYSDNDPDSGGELEQRAPDNPASCPPGQLRDVTDHDDKGGSPVGRSGLRCC